MIRTDAAAAVSFASYLSSACEGRKERDGSVMDGIWP